MLYSLRDVTEFKKKKSAIGMHTQKNRNKGDKSGKDKRQTKQEKLKYLRDERARKHEGRQRERKGRSKEITTFTAKVKTKDS